jgi:hypothetical protein
MGFFMCIKSGELNEDAVCGGSGGGGDASHGSKLLMVLMYRYQVYLRSTARLRVCSFVRIEPSAGFLDQSQTARLAAVLWGLLIFPASLQPGGLWSARLWLLLAVYTVFFSGGALRRLLNHGQLSPRSSTSCSVEAHAFLLLFSQ